MTVEDLAKLVITACAAESLDYLMTGAFAFGYYGIPRSTKDVDRLTNQRRQMERRGKQDELYAPDGQQAVERGAGRQGVHATQEVPS